MTQLESFASVNGRSLLREIYRELRYERQLGALEALAVCWRICTKEQELIRLTRRDVVVLHPLGILSGTKLWMEEVVNRFFYSVINAFVYAGAALLLLVVGLNRTGVIKAPSVVVAGIIIESLLLLLLFLVMYFTPPEEPDGKGQTPDGSVATEELLREIGEIGRDYAAMAVQLESIAESLTDLVERQDGMVHAMRESVNAAVNAVAPNPELMTSMQSTSVALNRFAEAVDALSKSMHIIEHEEVERLVRIELERLLSRRILESND
ncbi:MAG: hypothetical protein HYX66_03055 [Ignavibacteria bacterium]|nr:hypothetical protein [Ignavibacteria bacterium]